MTEIDELQQQAQAALGPSAMVKLVPFDLYRKNYNPIVSVTWKQNGRNCGMARHYDESETPKVALESILRTVALEDGDVV